ncbi:hypothetical protein CC668_25190 [Salmonella enterica subsp. enterica serovar Heidelberg]|uniref:Uncharacterized protein n=3 Tax=Enterobacterales TaxID=91347 RepID=B7JCJ3_ECOLX|nr:conserved hypothetical protein [Escherichia coli]ADR29925.1 hypothetical protein NRG857_30124 [Escherichia coli O83:H1 str. NRG 857C]EDH7545974.1 hypothetical protein [Salmonella enterica subsp. enterica serovar Heidelberg]EQO24970.1 hypothetical protein G709_05099 [Escherichia coli HVH 33 (4-2174936)]EQV64039.1 hypothetical protein G889_04060 [Escherichia coli KOEGE 61 (174a)]CZR15075.1 hypothetical protein [Yersinia pseudotuberculosis]
MEYLFIFPILKQCVGKEKIFLTTIFEKYFIFISLLNMVFCEQCIFLAISRCVYPSIANKVKNLFIIHIANIIFGNLRPNYLLITLQYLP